MVAGDRGASASVHEFLALAPDATARLGSALEHDHTCHPSQQYPPPLTHTRPSLTTLCFHHHHPHSSLHTLSLHFSLRIPSPIFLYPPSHCSRSLTTTHTLHTTYRHLPPWPPTPHDRTFDHCHPLSPSDSPDFLLFPRSPAPTMANDIHNISITDALTVSKPSRHIEYTVQGEWSAFSGVSCVLSGCTGSGHSASLFPRVQPHRVSPVVTIQRWRNRPVATV